MAPARKNPSSDGRDGPRRYPLALPCPRLAQGPVRRPRPRPDPRPEFGPTAARASRPCRRARCAAVAASPSGRCPRPQVRGTPPTPTQRRFTRPSPTRPQANSARRPISSASPGRRPRTTRLGADPDDVLVAGFALEDLSRYARDCQMHDLLFLGAAPLELACLALLARSRRDGCRLVFLRGSSGFYASPSLGTAPMAVGALPIGGVPDPDAGRDAERLQRAARRLHAHEALPIQLLAAGRIDETGRARLRQAFGEETEVQWTALEDELPNLAALAALAQPHRRAQGCPLAGVAPGSARPAPRRHLAVLGDRARRRRLRGSAHPRTRPAEARPARAQGALGGVGQGARGPRRPPPTRCAPSATTLSRSTASSPRPGRSIRCSCPC